MTTPVELFELAKELRVAGSEVRFRAAASRAYYALYHHCLAFHNALPVPGISAAAGIGGDHINLVHQLTHPAPEISKDRPEIHDRSRRLGVMLNTMRGLRHNADYRLSDQFTDNNADLVLATVKKGLSL